MDCLSNKQGDIQNMFYGQLGMVWCLNCQFAQLKRQTVTPSYCFYGMEKALAVNMHSVACV